MTTPAPEQQLYLPFSKELPQPRRDWPPADNGEIADRLEEIAQLLEAQGANSFRVRAYATAAQRLRDLNEPAHVILEREDLAGLERIRGIGRSLAYTIDQIVRTGRSVLLEQLRGMNEPEKLFASVAGIGPELAARIHDQLGIETLDELAAAADAGRLATVPGMGAKRTRAVAETLAGRSRRRATAKSDERAKPADEPPVAELLDIDRQYRHEVDLGRLPRIAPRRFNPTAEVWLPVLHTHRGDRHYTALYSNTARAHEMGTIRDWVVIYRDDEGGHARWTVITSRYGDLRDRRIVRGREKECAEYYRQQAVEPSSQT